MQAWALLDQAEFLQETNRIIEAKFKEDIDYYWAMRNK